MEQGEKYVDYYVPPWVSSWAVIRWIPGRVEKNQTSILDAVWTNIVRRRVSLQEFSRIKRTVTEDR